MYNTQDLGNSIMTVRYKIVFVGDISVGKTSVMNRFIDNNFTNDYDVINKTISTKSNTLHITIEDFYKYYNLLMNLRRVFLNEQMEKNINNLSTSQIKKLGED